jgi:ATP-dependent helicase/nuclease subunit A
VSEEEAPKAMAPLVLPQLPAYRLRRIVRPSTAFAETAPEQALATPAERAGDARDPEAARRTGIALHALLQHLTKVPQADWPAVSAKALGVLLPELPGEHEAIARKAQSILTRLDLIHIFGPNSRAEVPVLAKGTRNGSPVTIAGRIDRLVVEPDRVLLVDYKSDAEAANSASEVARGYLTQMGLYAQIAGQLFPSRTIEAGILWTSLESLMILPRDRLRQAISSFTIG